MVWQNNYGMSVDLISLVQSNNLETPEAILSYLVDLAYAGEITSENYLALLAILNESAPFDINANDAPDKLKRLLGNMLSAPAYQMQ